MKHVTRWAGAAALVLAAATPVAAAPLTVSYAATFHDMMGPVFGQALPHTFSTSFTVDSTAAPVDVVLAGSSGYGTNLYGYGLEAISGFSAAFGSHTFTDLVQVDLANAGAAYIYFDAPLSSGTASNFFLRAADGAGSLALGGLDCALGSCVFDSFAMVNELQGNLGIANLTSVQVSAPVPEPAAWALMLAGVVAVGAARRRSAR